jgi:hypothetical protein
LDGLSIFSFKLLMSVLSLPKVRSTFLGENESWITISNTTPVADIKTVAGRGSPPSVNSPKALKIFLEWSDMNGNFTFGLFMVPFVTNYNEENSMYYIVIYL